MAQDNNQLLSKVTQQTAARGGNVPAEASKRTFEGALIERKQQFMDALAGSGMSVERFIRVIIMEVMGNNDLITATQQNPKSVIGACLEMAQLGLDPAVPNEGFLIPYNETVKDANNRERRLMTAHFQPGYKGLMKMAGEAAKDAGIPLKLLRAEVIYQNDFYDRELGFEMNVVHRPPPFGQDRGNSIGYYAVAEDAFGRRHFREMTRAEVEKHKKRFMKAKFGPFADPENFDAYGLKTVVRKLCNKDLPMSPKLAKAISLDPEIDASKGALRLANQMSTIDLQPETGSEAPEESGAPESEQPEPAALPEQTGQQMPQMEEREMAGVEPQKAEEPKHMAQQQVAGFATAGDALAGAQKRLRDLKRQGE